MDIDREQITGAVLAGGDGHRLGGIDKGWYELAGQPLIERTLARIRPQCGAIAISANRSLDRYRSLGCPVCVDEGDQARGPLAGLARVLRIATTPYILVVPVDSPLLPLDLAARLAGAMTPATPLAVARCGERVHVLHALLRRDVLTDLETAFAAGIRSAMDWQTRLDRVIVDWPNAGAFVNINTDADVRTIMNRL